jgi:hypothetical protein
LRIKVFSWLVNKNRVLTRDNLKTKGWKGSGLCEFCDNLKSENHLFFDCPLAWYVWNVVGVALNLDAIPRSLSYISNVLPLSLGLTEKW